MKFEDVVAVAGPVGGAAATSPAWGRVLYEYVLRSGVSDILELGFAHGNSTCYMAAALHERETGSVLTMDRVEAEARSPNIHEMLARTQLQAFVRPVFAASSYNWELMRVLEQQREGLKTRPRFDFVFIDGAHDWETDALAFLLVDKLLKPGGLVLFDDIHWTLANSPTLKGSRRARSVPEDERHTPQIMRVFSLLVMQHPGYPTFCVKRNWAWAYKSGAETAPLPLEDLVDELAPPLPD